MGDVRQVKISHAGIAMAQHDPGARLVVLQFLRQVQVAGEPDALAIELIVWLVMVFPFRSTVPFTELPNFPFPCGT